VAQSAYLFFRLIGRSPTVQESDSFLEPARRISGS